MKKLILILSMFLVSCTPIFNYTPIVITNIEKSDKLYCNYYGYGQNIWTNNYDFELRDTCGKFQIGDTLNIVKQ